MMNSSSSFGDVDAANLEKREAEDELVAYLNSSDGSVLNESLIAEDVVDGQAREWKLLTENHKSLQKENEALKQALEAYKEELASSNETKRDIRKLVEEKQLEISDLSSRLEQALEAIQKLELSKENIKRLETCILENSLLKTENESLKRRNDILESQVKAVENHALSMKTTLASMNKELMDYMEKAKPVSSSRNELITSTPRSDSNSGSGSANIVEDFMAEITALKNERELLHIDLFRTRAIVDILTEENICLEKEMYISRSKIQDLQVQLKRKREILSNLLSEENVDLDQLKHGATVLKGMRCQGQAILDGDHHYQSCDCDVMMHSIDSNEGGRGGIVIKLGQPCILNQIRMLLCDRDRDGRSYCYYIEVSMDQRDWVRVCDRTRYHCRSWQCIFFPRRVVRFIKIVGTHNTVDKTFHVVGVEAFYTKKEFIIDPNYGLLVPKENVATIEQSALVIEGVPRSSGRNSLIDSRTGGYDWKSGYTCHKIGSGVIVVQLAQPYVLSSMRLLLWDCDNRSYSYYIEVSTNQCDWKTVCDRSRESCRSWQCIKFDPVPVVYIRLVGTHNSANDEAFHCVHFECPSQCDNHSEVVASCSCSYSSLATSSALTLENDSVKVKANANSNTNANAELEGKDVNDNDNDDVDDGDELERSSSVEEFFDCDCDI